VPFGTCRRCPWPANTLGPDRKPWHTYCWFSQGKPVSSWERWYFRQVTGEASAPRPATSVATEETSDRQWCATNRRWFRTDADMAGACPKCREQVEQEAATR
jgi:hypothetical protein